MEPSTIIPLLKDYGPWAFLFFTTAAYWLEKKAHDKTKEIERSRLIEELNYLNRVKQGQE